MKTLLLAGLCALAPALLPGQGTVLFNNRGLGDGLPAPVYLGSLGGPLLSGSGYSAQLFSSPGLDASFSSLLEALSPAVTFRTGTAAGYVAAITATLRGVAKDATSATLQMRAWYNLGGTVTNWAQVIAAGVPVGMSPIFNVQAIGGDLNVPPILTGLQSFSVPTPEPGVFGLAALGAALAWLFRRR